MDKRYEFRATVKLELEGELHAENEQFAFEKAERLISDYPCGCGVEIIGCDDGEVWDVSEIK